MSIPTLQELIDGGFPRVCFKEGNEAGYFQDHGFWTGLPSDIEFYVRPMRVHPKTQVELIAPGYGTRENYGNGSIFVSKDTVSRWRDADFAIREEEIIAAVQAIIIDADAGMVDRDVNNPEKFARRVLAVLKAIGK